VQTLAGRSGDNYDLMVLIKEGENVIVQTFPVIELARLFQLDLKFLP